MLSSSTSSAMTAGRSSTSTSTSTSSLSSLLSLLLLVASTALIAPVSAKLECNTNLGTYYPYCVNVPENANGQLPAIMFLSGSGARGDGSRVKELSGYDGVGKLINQYYSGNKGEAQTMAAEQFVTIIPISPKNVGGQEIRHWMPEHVQKVLADVLSKHGDVVDKSSLHLTGYSMGARGCWRNAVANPETWASIAPSAGGAEASGDGTLSQQAAPSVLDKLSAISSIPVWQFAGEWDSTAGTDSPKRTQAELEKAGDGKARLTIEKADHSGLSTMPFNAELMKWFLSNSGKGSGSTSSSSSSSNSESGDSSSSSSSSSDKVSSEGSNDNSSPSSSSASDSSSSGSSSSSSSGSNPKSKLKSGSKKCSSSSSSYKKAKRSASTGLYEFAHAGPVRRGIHDGHGGRPVARKTKSKRSPAPPSLSLAAMLKGRSVSSSSSNNSTKRSVGVESSMHASIPVDSFAANGNNAARVFAPTEFETVIQRRDPAIVAREQLKQSAASRVGKRMSR